MKFPSSCQQSSSYSLRGCNLSCWTMERTGSSRWVLSADRTRPALAISYGRLSGRPWSGGDGAAGGDGDGASWDGAASCSSWQSCALSSTSCAGSGTRFWFDAPKGRGCGRFRCGGVVLSSGWSGTLSLTRVSGSEYKTSAVVSSLRWRSQRLWTRNIIYYNVVSNVILFNDRHISLWPIAPKFLTIILLFVSFLLGWKLSPVVFYH